MQIWKKACTQSLSLSLFALTVGCASHTAIVTPSATTGPSGKAALGAVSGATVWADSTVSGSRYSIDTGADPAESATQTTTNTQGSFTIPAQPAYKYIIVSSGGTDTITNKSAGTIAAPSGAGNVTPLTTLVTFDQAATLAPKLLALLAGKPIDVDFTSVGAFNPASLLFATSVGSCAITSFGDALTARTTAGSTVTAQQLNAVKLTLWAAASQNFGSAASSLTNTSVLAITLQTALAAGFTQVANTNSNITGLTAFTIPNLSQTIANTCVANAANIVGNATGNTALQSITAANVQTAGVDVVTTGSFTETGVISGANLTSLTSAINSSAAAISGVITVSSTPANYTPPTLPVVQNPSVAGYRLVATRGSGEAWNVTALTVTFSDDMATSGNGSVTNASNYAFNNGTCTPQAYAATTKTVSFTCTGVRSGDFTVTVLAATSTGGVRNTATVPLGLLFNNVKSFVLPSATGSTGGSSVNLF